VRHLLILTAVLGLLGAGQALSPTIRAAAAVKDTGGSGSGAATTIGAATTTAAATTAATTTVATTTPSPGAITGIARQYVGYPYAYIGDDPSTGFSCIGFAHYVFAQNGVYVPEELGRAYGSAPHVDQADLRPGDLVFFQNTVWDGISHVDLYIGDGKMIGADSYQSGVQWDTLGDSYWQDHYLGATRPLSNPTGAPIDPSSAQLPSGPSLTPPAGPTLAVKAGTVILAHDTATVYSGPGASYASIDTVTHGITLTTVQTQGQWVNVAYDGGDQYGWVHGHDLNLPPGAAGPDTSGKGQNSAAAQPVPGTVAQPVSATVTTVTSSPVSATVQGGPGRAHTPVQSVKGFHASHGGARVLVVMAAVLYVRAAPDRHARVLRRVHAGDRLRLLKARKGWDYVAQRDDARGWVNASFVH